MIPLHLKISGFLSYHEPVELDFTTFDLACIAGPNGAGKSSLLDAITWALFGQARRRDDALIHTNSSSAEVCLTFGYEGNVYRVQRSKPRDKTVLLEFHILQREDFSLTSGRGTPVAQLGPWKPLTERTLRETEARIAAILRMDYETFVNASFFLQGKADQFTQQRPGDRKRILGNILGLEVWETYRGRAQERRKVVENEIAGLDGRLADIVRELAEEAPRKKRLKELEADLERLSRERLAQEMVLESARKIAATLAEQEKLVLTLARQLESAGRRRIEMTGRLTERCKERDSYTGLTARAAEIEAAYAAWQSARAELERWEETAARFRQAEKTRQGPLDEINAAHARLSQEFHSLQAHAAEIETARPQADALRVQIAALQASLVQAEEQLARRERLDAELQDARQRKADANAENPRLRKEMDDLKVRIDRLKETEGAACPVCGQPLSPTERLRLVEELNALGKELGDRFRANKALLDQADGHVRQLETQIHALTSAEKELRIGGANLAQLAGRLEGLEAQAQSWEANGGLRLQEVRQILAGESFAPEARLELRQIDAGLLAIGYDAEAHDSVRRAEAGGRESETELRRLDRARAALAPLEREIADLERQTEALRIETARQGQEHADAAAALAAARAQAPDLEAAERALLELEERENRLRLEVGAARQKVLILDDLRLRRKTLENHREALARRVGQYKQLERAFGKDGVPALLIEQALPEIETRSNEILDRLTGGNMSVRFVTQSAYKDKRRDDLKETLDILISDGAGTRDYELFSGGEAFRVNFAVRLALAEVLAQRAGARLQTLVIDEGFGSQDAEGRQRLIEAINLVRSDFAKILVITHIEELKEAFPNRIEIEKTSRGSTARII